MKINQIFDFSNNLEYSGSICIQFVWMIYVASFNRDQFYSNKHLIANKLLLSVFSLACVVTSFTEIAEPPLSRPHSVLTHRDMSHSARCMSERDKSTATKLYCVALNAKPTHQCASKNRHNNCYYFLNSPATRRSALRS